MKKIVITGSNGLLGQTLITLLLKEKNSYEIIGFSRGKNRSNRSDFNYVSIDITDRKKLTEKLEEIQPDCIVNTAAMTNVDVCEKNPEACNEINVQAVQYLSEIAQKINAQLIHISTDFIFDGKQGFYKETDLPNPLSVYGVSKLKSEKITQKTATNYTILRTILVYGKVANMTKSNLVLWVKESLENQKEISIVTDQYRSPTFADELARACQLAIDKRIIGVFNISSKTLLSIYEIAQQIADVFQLDKKLIKPITTAQLNQAAQRPAKTGFDLSKSEKELHFYANSFLEDLQEFKEKLS